MGRNVLQNHITLSPSIPQYLKISPSISKVCIFFDNERILEQEIVVLYIF